MIVNNVSAERVRNYLNVESILKASLEGGKGKDFFIVDWDGDKVNMELYLDKSGEWHEKSLEQISDEHNIPMNVLHDYCVVDLWLNNNLDMLFKNTNKEGHVFSFSEAEGCKLTAPDGEAESKTFSDVVDAFDSMPKDEWTFEACHRIINDYD